MGMPERTTEVHVVAAACEFAPGARRLVLLEGAVAAATSTELAAYKAAVDEGEVRPEDELAATCELVPLVSGGLKHSLLNLSMPLAAEGPHVWLHGLHAVTS